MMLVFFVYYSLQFLPADPALGGSPALVCDYRPSELGSHSPLACSRSRHTHWWAPSEIRPPFHSVPDTTTALDSSPCYS